MRHQFIVDASSSFTTYVFEDNRKVVVTSALITVYKPNSSDKLVDGAAMTVAADGLLSYSLSAADNDIAGDGYKVLITYVRSAVTYYLPPQFYDVVISVLGKVIVDEDIIAELPQLNDKGLKIRGTAKSGSITTLVDTELKNYPDDYFTGGVAHSLVSDERRAITDFVQSTGTVTTAAFATAISTDKYILTRSFTKEIQRAFEKIENWILQKGRRAHLVLDSYDLREVHIALSVAEACKSFATASEGGLWWDLWDRFDKRAFSLFNSLDLKYDDNADGLISLSEEHRRVKKRIVRG